MKKTVFYHRGFRINAYGHGGEKRSHQIFEFLNSNFNLIDIRANIKQKSRYISYPLTLLFLLRYNISLKYLKQKAQILNTLRFFENSRTVSLLFLDLSIDEWKYFSFYKAFCRTKNIKIIVFPHNLESLVPLHLGKKQNLDIKVKQLKKELEFYRNCDLLVTISREENWLLDLFNISSVYMPYSPSKDLFSELQEIKQYRQHHPIEDYIFINATYHNPPTQKGLQKLLKLIQKNPLNQQIIISGFGTEKLKEEITTELSNNIKVVGAISKEQLMQHYKRCKAVLIYQENSSGVLTKLSELILMGIPVISNMHSLRSFFNIKGLYILEEEKNIDNLLKQNLENPDYQLSSKENRVIKSIKDLLS